jgi:subtilisin family serine protease
MASPHVTGLVALLWSADPALIGQIDQTETLIRQTARPTAVEAACPIEEQTPGESSILEELEALQVGNACTCGGVSGTPNNVYGWGEIDAWQAVEAALRKEY